MCEAAQVKVEDTNCGAAPKSQQLPPGTAKIFWGSTEYANRLFLSATSTPVPPIPPELDCKYST